MVFEGSDRPRADSKMGDGKEEKQQLLLEIGSKDKYGSFPVPSTSFEAARNICSSSSQRRVSKTRQKEIVFIISLMCFVAIMLGLIFGLPPFLPYKVQFRFKKEVAVADSPYCSAIGRGVLERNGSAMDAAVSMVLCQGVVSPHVSGLGGGVYFLHYHQQSFNASVLDSLEGVPRRLVRARQFPSAGGAPLGPLSVAVPSQLRGLWNAHATYGKLSWREVVDPVSQLCFKGVVVYPELADSLQQHRELILRNRPMKEVFTEPRTGRLLQVGDVMHNERLCRALRLIVSDGPEESLRGWFAMEVGAELGEQGTFVSATDIASLRADWKAPVTSSFSARGRGFLLHTSPPPSDGLKTALALGILDGFQLHKETAYEPTRRVAIGHYLVEAFKHAFGLASAVEQAPRPQQQQMVKKLLSPKNLSSIRTSIGDTTFPGNSSRYLGDRPLQLPPQDSEGSSVVVLAANGDAVIATSSLNSKFGSGIMSDAVGCVFNNQLDKYRQQPSPLNVSLLVRDPDRRIPSSATPLLLEDRLSRYGVLMLAGSGGTHVTTSVVQAVANHLLFEEELPVAVDLPRIHHQLHPDVLLYEEGSDMNVVDGLKARGNEVEKVFKLNAVLSAVRKMRDGSVIATYDRRGVGFADGI